MGIEKAINAGQVERRFAPVSAGAPSTVGSAEGAKIVGYAAVFNSPSAPLADRRGEFIEVIRPGAFADAILADDVRCLFNHDSNFVLGRNRSGTLSLVEDQIGLRYECTPSQSPLAQHVLECLRRGDVSGSSFAFMVIEDNWTQGADGQRQRELVKLSLMDVSPVTYPAYPAASSGVAGGGSGRSSSTPRLDVRRPLRELAGDAALTPGIAGARMRMSDLVALQEEAKRQGWTRALPAVRKMIQRMRIED